MTQKGFSWDSLYVVSKAGLVGTQQYCATLMEQLNLIIRARRRVGDMRGEGGGRALRRGACVAGEMATAADGMHPSGMHSCILMLTKNIGLFFV